MQKHSSVQFSSLQSLSRVRLFATPWITTHQASLSITNSWAFLKLMSNHSVMVSNHLILCHPSFLLPSIFSNNVVLEKTLESPLDCKEIQPVNPKGNQSNIHWKDWCWSWNSNTLATLCEELTDLKRPWYWEKLKVWVEGDDRGWDMWMASPTQWTWVWVNSGSWWWTRRPVVLQSMGLQRVGHDWVTEVNWTDMCNGLPRWH